MKYIIKNCPACILDPSCCAQWHINNGNAKDCSDITDCTLKRIVERCSLYEFNYPVNQAIQMLTQNIKDMLEIEEVDEM